MKQKRGMERESRYCLMGILMLVLIKTAKDMEREPTLLNQVKSTVENM